MSYSNTNTNILASKENQEKKMLPEIILSQDEKIVLNQEVHELLMRGERNEKKLFISIASFGNIFGIKRLENDILKSKNEGIDYVMLNICKIVNGRYVWNKKPYFTYHTLLKYVFSSKKQNILQRAKEVREYFEKVLFINQPIIEKKSSDCTIDDVKKVLNLLSLELSCIYLLSLGTVKELRNRMKIDDKYSDNLIICKFGRTKNLYNRLTNHNNTFRNLGCNVIVKYIAPVDFSKCADAEDMIKKYIKDEKISFSFSSFKELAIVDKHTLNNKIKEQYTLLQKIFCTENKHLNVLLKEYEHKLEKVQLEHKVEITKYESSLKETTTKYESSLKETTTKYEIEIQRLKYELEIEKMKAKLSKYEK